MGRDVKKQKQNEKCLPKNRRCKNKTKMHRLLELPLKRPSFVLFCFATDFGKKRREKNKTVCEGVTELRLLHAPFSLFSSTGLFA